MLPDRDRELLTAYVDGELAGPERRYVERLLGKSRPARDLLRRLQEDARALQGLPTPRLDRDLSGPVVDQIIVRRLRPNRRRFGGVPSRPMPAWSGLAAAAAILLVVGFSSYTFFALTMPDDTPSPPYYAKTRPNPAPPDRPTPPDKPVDPPDLPGPEPRIPTPPVPPTEVVKQPEPERPEGLRGPKDDLITAPSMEMFDPEKEPKIEVIRPHILRLHDQDQAANLKKLREELKKDSAFRIEMPCKDGTKALERLHPVLRARQVGVVLDAFARWRLAHPQWNTNYVVYVEDLTPEELTALMQALAAEDNKKPDPKRPPERQFDQLLVWRMSDRDHKQLTDLLGSDPTRTPPKSTETRKGYDEQTLTQLEHILASKPGTKPVTKGLERLALAAAYNPESVRPKPGSPEVKRFLELRRAARPGTVSVLLVLRATS